MTGIIVDRFKDVDPEKELFLGHQHERRGMRSIDKKCDYCGKWICFDVKKYEDWGDNIKIGFNGVPEKVHCNSLHCQEYHRRVLLHNHKMRKELAVKHENLFNRLKALGAVA